MGDTIGQFRLYSILGQYRLQCITIDTLRVCILSKKSRFYTCFICSCKQLSVIDCNCTMTSDDTQDSTTDFESDSDVSLLSSRKRPTGQIQKSFFEQFFN